MRRAEADAALNSLIKGVLSSGASGKNVLVIDVGGTSVKILATRQTEVRSFRSGPTLTPTRMVSGVKKIVRDWTYEVVSIGYPGPVLGGRPTAEPANLGRGWIGFDFAAAFARPVKVVNDAAMQAMGSYKGGRMLFLGLGTGLGTALIVDGMMEPMELGHLPYKKHTYENDTVIGGGNVKKLDALPPRCRAGHNANAFLGGFRLWAEDNVILPDMPPARARSERKTTEDRPQRKARTPEVWLRDLSWLMHAP